MAEDKIRMPMGQGGLVRYFDESHSKFEFSPGMIIILCLVIIGIIVLLHYFGGRILGY
jgi:preprotein translocase subunit Sec61beta